MDAGTITEWAAIVAAVENSAVVAVAVEREAGWKGEAADVSHRRY